MQLEDTNAETQKSRRSRAQKSLSCLLFLTAAASCAPAVETATASEPLPLLVETVGDYRYEFHVPTGREFLYDARSDERGLVNLIDDHADEAAACRRALETRLGPGALDAMRARYSDTIRRLRALGYL
jgi:hypothetical protein